jgi:3',5'-cyclic AMP phosphodiesterase CpdA
LSFLLGHISDPHVGPVLRPRWRELAGKRFTGYINWRRGRHLIHDMAMLERITADLLAQKPDHVALTGDLVNIGLESEFVTAQRYIERVGGADFVSVIPGNHDVYVRSSFRYFAASAAPWMTGDGTATVAFPYVRVRGGVALIGLSSGVPTAPLLASGECGDRQLRALAVALEATKASGHVRVVMIHHPPHRTGASMGRGLRDARAFEKVIAVQGAELVIHGHNHRYSVERIPGPDGTSVPIIGVASASAVPGSINHRAGYHLYRIAREGDRATITLQVRGLNDEGAIADLGTVSLD